MSQLVRAHSRPTLPPPESGPIDVLFVAGEHSGDQHAATLALAARKLQPGLRFAALGGPALAATGVQVLHDLTGSSVVGFVEVLRNLSYFRALMRETVRWIETYRPRAVCFIDYPGFNLRVAATLRERGITRPGGGNVRALYYISPQIWAWKARRRFTMARDLDALAAIFPFEVDCYADTQLPVDFVGHPFVDPGYKAPVSHDVTGPVLLLPGSRKQAVARIFPLLLKGFYALGEREAVVLYPSEAIRQVLLSFKPNAHVHLQPMGTHVAASAVLTSSGTMSMHCALAGIPGAIAYRANPLTYWIGRRLVKVKYIGIANLLLDSPMYPEYIQGAATADALSLELKRCLRDIQRQLDTRINAERLRLTLRQPAAGTAADWLVHHLD